MKTWNNSLVLNLLFLPFCFISFGQLWIGIPGERGNAMGLDKLTFIVEVGNKNFGYVLRRFCIFMPNDSAFVR